MRKAPFIGLILAALPLAGARAAPATADEASRLAAVFQRYVPAPAEGQPAAVTVVPEGDAYRVTLDLKQALRGLEGFGVTLDPAVSSAMLTPEADGTWKVAVTDTPPVTIHAKDQSIALKVAGTRFAGIYDPRMFSFRSSDAQYTGYDYASTGPNAVQNSHIDALGFTSSALPAEGGTVTGTTRETVTGIRADMLTKPPGPPPAAATGGPAQATPPRPTTALSYAAPAATADIGFEKLHAKDLLDLWAFLVAHPNRDSLVAAQDEFRGILRAALPLASALKESSSADGLTLTSPIGVFSAKTVAVGLDLESLDGPASATANVGIGGLAVPPGQLPPWSQGLVPTDLSLVVSAGGLQLAEAGAEAVNDFDLRSDRPFTPEQTARISTLAMPGAVSVSVLPSRLASRLLDLEFEGGATIGTAPEGHITIRAKGLDNAIATLQSAAGTDPSAAQALGPLVLAKNLAKPEADGTLSWIVEAKPGAPVTVNGTPFQ